LAGIEGSAALDWLEWEERGWRAGVFGVEQEIEEARAEAAAVLEASDAFALKLERGELASDAGEEAGSLRKLTVVEFARFVFVNANHDTVKPSGDGEVRPVACVRG
jgi:hypothetical protein